jgi:hypothetical protein
MEAEVANAKILKATLKVVKGEVEMMRVEKEKLKVGARGGEEMKVEMVVYDVV